MKPTDVAEAAQSAGLTPSVQMLLVIVAIAIVLAVPAFYLVRDLRRKGAQDKSDEKTESVKTGLYQHLYEQVSILTKRLDKIHDEYNTLVRTNAELEARIKALEGCEAREQALRGKLDEKDATIAIRDAQINEMFKQIGERDTIIFRLQDRVHTLEQRVARDEQDWNRDKDDLK